MRTVLIIEDEEQTRNIFLKCLKFEGFRAFGAGDGTTGVALAQDRHPDIIVCDVMMPDMDGYSVLAALRESQATASIPLIFLTAKVTMADLRRAMEMGADDYLTKPCTVEQFLAAVNARLKRHEELSQLYGRAKNGVVPVREAARSPLTPSPETSAELPDFYPDCPKLAVVFRFIEAHYRQPINLRDVAQEAGYAPAYLTSLVQGATGRTVKRWIIERRMARARSLLVSTADSVRAIAESSGYVDAGYFNRQFRQFHGVSPQAWRQSQIADG